LNLSKKILRKVLQGKLPFLSNSSISEVLTNVRILNKNLPNSYFLSKKGYCYCCEQEVEFVSFHPWLRDNFKCNNCHSIPRERALMKVINTIYPNWKELEIHESSPGLRGASSLLKSKCKNYRASQFYVDKDLGTTINGFVNIDLENQSFPDEIFDLVITQDVMEHEYNPEKSFKEIARTLKPGGAHIFTVPIINKFKETLVWATLNSDGEPNFLHKPEYHGNPINENGSPVTMHWGYDIVSKIKEFCGLNTEIVYIDNLKEGIRAEYIEVLVTRKD
jgi:SAM-dependent methyltransferase